MTVQSVVSFEIQLQSISINLRYKLCKIYALFLKQLVGSWIYCAIVDRDSRLKRIA